jgi:hypothetical protein
MKDLLVRLLDIAIDIEDALRESSSLDKEHSDHLAAQKSSLLKEWTLLTSIKQNIRRIEIIKDCMLRFHDTDLAAIPPLSLQEFEATYSAIADGCGSVVRWMVVVSLANKQADIMPLFKDVRVPYFRDITVSFEWGTRVYICSRGPGGRTYDDIKDVTREQVWRNYKLRFFTEKNRALLMQRNVAQ